MTTLGEDLPKEMARVRDEVMPAYQSVGMAGNFALTLMRRDLDTAARAMISGDLVEMLRCYRSLQSHHI